MKTNILVVCILFLCCKSAISQIVDYNYLPLPHKMETNESKITAVENAANKKLKISPKSKEQITIWKFIVYDSLELYVERDILINSIDFESKYISKKIKMILFYNKGAILINDLTQIKEAIENLMVARDLSKLVDSKIYLTKSSRMIGLGYKRLLEFEKAVKFLEEGYRMAVVIQDNKEILNGANTLANCYKSLRQFEKAQEYYDIALDMGIKIDYKRMIAGTYNNIGNLKKELQKPQEALNYYLKAVEMNIELKNKQWLGINYDNIGMIYSELGLMDKAIDYFLLAQNIAKELKDIGGFNNSTSNLSATYAKIKNYKKAYEYLLLSNKIKDSLQLDEQKNALHEFEAKYESEKKQLEIERLEITGKYQKEKNKTLEMKAERAFNLGLVFIFAGIILIGSVLLLIRRNRQRMATNNILNEKNVQIQNTNVTLQDTLSELSVKNKEIIDSINYATYIQRASLPNLSQQSSDLLKFELFFAPKDIVSGDFYFSYQMQNKSIFGVADCTGHGVPGAMVALIGMNSIDKVIREENHFNTGKMVESLNKHVLENLQRGKEMINDGMDLSFCVLDHEIKTLKFSGAHHDAYILRKSNENNETVEETEEVKIKIQNTNHVLYALKGARRPIGNWHANTGFFEVQFNVKQGDRIVLFSDGYADQLGGVNDKKMKMKKGKMLELILESGNLDSTRQMEMLKDEFTSWQGTSDQVDDVCLLITEIF